MISHIHFPFIFLEVSFIHTYIHTYIHIYIYIYIYIYITKGDASQLLKHFRQ